MKSLSIDHILLIVKDVNKTSEFYSKIFGKPTHQDADSVSWKFENTKIFFGHPFREIENNSFDRNRIGLNHIAWGARALDELQEWQKKLDDVAIKNSGIIRDNYQDREYIWFDDPDGIRQEFYFRPEDEK
jgi:catechol 2,3-dioxygenase-like lactoylglutathione lyase family enzyme